MQRFCHVSALKWDDVDFESAVVCFRRKQVRGDVGPISRKKPAPRVAPLTEELAVALKAHHARMAKLGYPVDAEAWLFPTRNGKLKQPSSLANAIKSSVAEARITVRITPHTMRYMFNDALRLPHVDKIIRKAMVGHVTDDMTEHYSTVLLEEKREAMEAAAAKLRVKLDPNRGDDRGYGPEKKKAA
jgi:integrase